MNVKIKSAEFRALRKRISVSTPVLAGKFNTSAQCIHYFETGKIAAPRWPVDSAAEWMRKVDERRSAA